MHFPDLHSLSLPTARLWTPPWPVWPGLLAGFTSRQWREAPDTPWRDDWNFRRPDDDTPPPGLAHLRQVLQIPNLPVVGEQQVHGAAIQIPSPAALSSCSFTLIPSNDGILLSDPGALALAQSADCCIGLLIEPTRHLSGVFHAGWRGAVQGLPLRMVETCAAEFGVPPQELWVALGPTIQQQSFQVGPEVREACLEWESRLPCFDHERLLQPDPTALKRWRLDLPGFVVAQLLAAGVMPEHLAVSQVDTYSTPTACFSYRREGPGMGLQVGFCGWQRVR